MELELEAAAGGRGSRVVSLSGDAPAADLGRGDLDHGGPSKDRTVSRRHVSLRFLDGGGDPGVAFEVLGRNPVVVRLSLNAGGGRSSRMFRCGETGELRSGDALSLSLKAPSFWTVRRKGGSGEGEVEASVLDAVARREKRTRERKERERLTAEEAMEVTKEEEKGEAVSEVDRGEAISEVEGLEIDLASVDPVKEFGFLSMGHEFDSYPKGRIRPPEDWNWFLEEIKRSSDDEDDEVSNSRGRPKGKARNKNKDEGEDKDWADESEDEKESLSRGPGAKRTKYVTRSKDPKKPRKENPKVKSSNNKDENDDVEEEEDETLGGFIVNEEDEAMDELSEDEEEEEFDDEDDDD